MSTAAWWMTKIAVVGLPAADVGLGDAGPLDARLTDGVMPAVMGPPLVAVGPLVWALALGWVALILLLPASSRRRRLAGTAVGLLSLVLLLTGVLAPLLALTSQVAFWVLATVTLVAAVGAIATPLPVYSALWLALCLLGTAGLMFFNGAQFLGVATIAVYAGAIVVMFLFVLMLAQPGGHEPYDRLTWGWYTKFVSAGVATVLVGLLTFTVVAVDRTSFPAHPAEARNVLDADHVARFGGELFGRHLLSVEIAGTLLLVALVGSVAIMIYGRDPMMIGGEGADDDRNR